MAAAVDTVPATVRDAALARAARLSAAAREVAEFVCVIPGKTEPWLLEQAIRPSEEGIEGCVNIGMVRDEDGSLAYRHELTRRAIEGSLSRPRLQLLHEKVLAVLAARSGVPAARLVFHADGARNGAEVLRFAPVAASQAASVGAHREAASHYQMALRYADVLQPADRARLQEQLSYEYYLTGQYEPAIEVRRSALEIWRGSAERTRKAGRYAGCPAELVCRP